MNKKAIKFPSKKEFIDGDTNELFEPYSFDMLRETGLIEMLFTNHEELIQSVDEWESTKSNVFSSQETDGTFINEPNDINSPCVYDYISDANVLIELWKAKGVFSDKLKKLLIMEHKARVLLHRAKVDLSVIVNVDWIEKNSYVNIVKDRYCKKDNQNGYELEDSNRAYQYILKYFPVYRYLMDVKKLYKLNCRSVDMLHLAVGDNEASNVKEDIIEQTAAIFSQYKTLTKIVNGIKNDEIERYQTKHTGSDRGCLAIMQEVGGSVYFALSGVDDYHQSNKYKTFDKIRTTIYNKLVAANGNITQPTSINYVWANLNDNVLSYVDMKNGYDSNDITPINKAISFGDFLASNCGGSFKLLPSDKKRYFSCCERKIFAHGKPDTNKTFFVRWKPCKLCIPAFEQTGGLKTVHYLNSNNNPKSMTYPTT